MKLGFDESTPFSPLDVERAQWCVFIADGRAKPWMNSLTVCEQRAKKPDGAKARKLLEEFKVYQAVRRLTK